MPSSFESTFSASVSSLFDVHGEPVGYRSTGGLPEAAQKFKNVQAIVDREPDRVVTDVAEGSIIVQIQKSDVSVVYEDRDQVRVDGKNKRVSVLEEDGGVWTLECS